MNEEMLLQLGDKAEQALQVLGEKLGQGAEYVWPLLVRQHQIQAINAIAGVAFGLLVLFVVIISIVLAQKSMQKNNISWDDVSVQGVIIIAGLIVSFVLTIVLPTAFFAEQLLPKLLNPEYYALQEIFNLIN